jgi:glycerophosphoryl diester phosphodiesterase
MKVIGHRGARGLAPENTIEGITMGLEHGVDAIEIDVRITKDNIVVLNHDRYINNLFRGKLLIHDHSYAELLQNKSDIPTLDQAIRFIDRRVQIIIEIKPNVPLKPVIDVIKSVVDDGWTPDDLAFVSFDYKILKQLKSAFPQHQIIIDEMWSGLRALSRAKRLGSKDISLYNPVIWPGFIRLVNNLGYRLYSFPQNDREQAMKWHKIGYYGAITDRPDLFQKP